MICAHPAQVVLDALDQAGSRVRGRSGRWMACCPAHDDRTPSLSVREFGDGNVWLHCFAGCETEHVLDRLGLSFADLFATRTVGDAVVPGRELPPAWANPLARAVLDVLHDHAFNGPTCHPSQELIAAQIRAIHGWPTTRETVNRVCAWLRSHGFIDWHQERAPGSKWRHNVYRLHCTWIRPLRRKLLDRLRTLRYRIRKPFNHYSPVPVPLSVIRAHEHDRAGLVEPGFGLVGAQHARAGPL